MQLEAGLLLEDGATLSSVLPAGTSELVPRGDVGAAEDEGGRGGAGEEVRCRIELRVDSDGAGGCTLGRINVTRERKYRRGFDDGLLYKGAPLRPRAARPVPSPTMRPSAGGLILLHLSGVPCSPLPEPRAWSPRRVSRHRRDARADVSCG